MKSIIVHANDDTGFEGRLAVAMDAARALDAHLTCLHVTPYQAYVTVDPFGGAYVSQAFLEEVRERDERFRATHEARLGREDVRWDWRSIDGDPATVLSAEASLADLVVVSQYSAESGPDQRPLPLVDQLVVNAGCATLVVPKHCQSLDLSRPMLIGWNASEQAARAIRHALPLIALSSSVHLLSVSEDDEEDFPQTGASTYLSRHGVSTELHRLARKGPIDRIITEFARSVGAGSLVMGAYGHSRLRETLLGGVTKRMLAEPEIPLILGR